MYFSELTPKSEIGHFLEQCTKKLNWETCADFSHTSVIWSTNYNTQFHLGTDNVIDPKNWAK